MKKRMRLLVFPIVCVLLLQGGTQTFAEEILRQEQVTEQVLIDAKIRIPDLSEERPSIFEAKSYDMPLSAIIDALALQDGEIVQDESSTRYEGKNTWAGVTDIGNAYYKQGNRDVYLTILNAHRDYLARFDASWLKNGDDLEDLPRSEVVASVDALLQAIGARDWEIDYEVYPIHAEDVQETLAQTNARDQEQNSFSFEDEAYFIQARCMNDGLAMDDVDYELLNEQTILRTYIDVLWGRNGLISLDLFGYRIPLQKTEPTEELLGLDQAIDVLTDYFDGILMSKPVTVKEIALVYCAYPISENTFQLVPAWRFGVSRDGTYIDGFYRINAYTGKFLE